MQGSYNSAVVFICSAHYCGFRIEKLPVSKLYRLCRAGPTQMTDFGVRVTTEEVAHKRASGRQVQHVDLKTHAGCGST